MAKAKGKPKRVETEEVTSTKQVLERGSSDMTVVGGETRTVETTTAVFEEVAGGERGAHRAVFEQGEPRAADEE